MLLFRMDRCRNSRVHRPPLRCNPVAASVRRRSETGPRHQSAGSNSERRFQWLPRSCRVSRGRWRAAPLSRPFPAHSSRPREALLPVSNRQYQLLALPPSLTVRQSGAERQSYFGLGGTRTRARIAGIGRSYVRTPRVDNALMREYHDREWGVTAHDDRTHFEFLVLEAAQAGLSWSIVLNKREGYRRAFSQFDPKKVARYSVAKIEKLTADAGIIRNRMKIAAAVKNARAFLQVQEEFGSFDAYSWQFVNG